MPNDLNNIRSGLEGFDGQSAGREILGVAAVEIGGRATTKFMRFGGSGADQRNPQTGVGSLRRQSGRLARSLIGARSTRNPTVSGIRGAPEGIFRIRAVQSGARLEYGSRVPYAAIHEYGGSVQQQVPQHTRTIDQAFGRPLESSKTITVRAHTRQMTMPERPYLRPALGDALPSILDFAERTVVEALGLGGSA